MSFCFTETAASIIRQFYVIDAQNWSPAEKARQKREIFDRELATFARGGWASAEHIAEETVHDRKTVNGVTQPDPEKPGPVERAWRCIEGRWTQGA